MSDTKVVSVGESTADLMRTAVEVAREFGTAKAVNATEPDTKTEGVFILDTHGGIKPLPASYFDEYRTGPKRLKGSAHHTRLESFIEHVNKFKTESSALFAVDNMKSPSLTAVLDYHVETANSIHGDRPQAGFGEHRAIFNFPLSEEFQIWLKNNDAKMTRDEFAQFLEDRFIDVEHVNDPSSLNDDIRKLLSSIGAGGLGNPTKLIELSRGLVVHEKSSVVNTGNLATGAGQISFKTEQTGPDGLALDVPTVFVLNIPIFARGDIYRVAARLRFRVNGGNLLFWYELWGIDRVFELAFTEACERAITETELPLFFGRPE